MVTVDLSLQDTSLLCRRLQAVDVSRLSFCVVESLTLRRHRNLNKYMQFLVLIALGSRLSSTTNNLVTTMASTSDIDASSLVESGILIANHPLIAPAPASDVDTLSLVESGRPEPERPRDYLYNTHESPSSTPIGYERSRYQIK